MKQFHYKGRPLSELRKEAVVVLQSEEEWEGLTLKEMLQENWELQYGKHYASLEASAAIGQQHTDFEAWATRYANAWERRVTDSEKATEAFLEAAMEELSDAKFEDWDYATQEAEYEAYADNCREDAMLEELD